MEIYLEVDDVRRAMPLVEQLLAELGFKDDAVIETALLDDEDEDEDEDEDRNEET